MTQLLVNKNTNETILEKESTMTELRQLADIMGELTAQIKEFENSPAYVEAVQSLAKAKSAVISLAKELPSTQSMKIAGKTYTLKISAASKVRKVANPQKLFELLGEKPFVTLAKVPLSAIDDYLTPEQKDQVLVTTQSGSRSIKVLGV